MMNSEMTPFSLNKKSYERANEEFFFEQSLSSGENCEWDSYYAGDFDFEFKDEFSTKEERSEELIAVQGFELDEKSTPTIVASFDEESEISDESIESSVYFCFREIDISDSQLKIQNVFNSYPVPSDPGLAAAFWSTSHETKNYGDDFFRKYTDLAKKMKLRPISCLKELFTKSEFNLRYHGLDPKSFKPISETLVDDTFVNILDLKDNWLTVDACFHLNELLLQNTFIETLNLSGCRIGASGAKKIQEGLMTVPNLLNLNLSHCELGDEGLNNICSGIYLNESLQSLDLSDNHLREKCAKDLEAIISRSQTLVRLNLSWNSLHYKEVCRAVFNSLANNLTIEEIDLSWNAIGSESTIYVSSFLSKSSNLKILDLSWNQFVEVDQITKALAKNSVLEKFYFGNNPLKRTEVLNLIEFLASASENKLEILDFENIWLEKNVLPALEMIGNTKPWLVIKLGGILGNFKLIGPNVRHLLLRRANFEASNTKKKKGRKNFGHFVLSLNDTPISFKKFSELVKNFKLKLSDSLVSEIGKAFSVRKNLIDQKEIKSFYLKEYPGTELPTKIKKDKKSKKAKKDNVKTKKQKLQKL